MKRKIFLLCGLALFVFTVSSCKDDGSEPKEKNPLVGEWYEVGSTDAKGLKVVFTETNVTAFYYANDYVDYKGSVWNYEEKFYDGVKYLLNNDTLEMFEHYFAYNVNHLKTKIIFHSNDTLFIEVFLPTDADVPFPHNYTSIYLVKNYGE